MRAGDARLLGVLVVAVALARDGHALVKMAVESEFIDFAYHDLTYLASLRAEVDAWSINLSSWATLRWIFPHAVADGLTLAVILGVVAGFARVVPRRVAPGSRAFDRAWGLALAAALLASGRLLGVLALAWLLARRLRREA